MVAMRPEGRRRFRSLAVRLAPLVLGLALVLGAPGYLPDQFYLRVATFICFYGVLALGWNVIGGYADQLSLGHAVFFAIGAYATALLQVDVGLTPWVGVVLATALGGLTALAFGLLTFRWSGTYFTLATLALLEIGGICATYFRGLTRGPSGISIPILHDSPAMMQFDSPLPYYYLAAAMLLGSLLVSWLVLTSKLGYRLRAIRANREAAQLAGVNLVRSKLAALVISASLVAAAGGFYAEYIQFIDPDSTFSLQLTVNMALFAIVGGVSTWWGPALGAAIMVPITQYTSMQLTGRLAPLGEVGLGLILITVILLRPQGVAPALASFWNALSRRFVERAVPDTRGVG
jgi:branched-chain amino acid transport system permease protein